ncbi:MAG: hypothetical protein H0X02_01875 [Nitrosomonas sp.]|nr:hypothetical protein [Nitrosomonas sp.]
MGNEVDETLKDYELMIGQFHSEKQLFKTAVRFLYLSLKQNERILQVLQEIRDRNQAIKKEESI